MSYGMYVSALGAEAQNLRLQVISNNLANTSTLGFKREIPVVQARASEAIELGLDSADRESGNNVGGGIRVEESKTDFSLGVLKPTGVPTDVALQSPETFFVVQKDGRQHLTRAGNFQILNGRLVTADGLPVLSRAGTPVVVDPSLPYRFLPEGILDQPGGGAELAIVKPKSPADLVRVGANLFRPLATPPAAEASERRVQSGYVEESGVSPTMEMLEMIRTTRAYEANVRMIQNHDNVTGQLLNRVLRQ